MSTNEYPAFDRQAERGEMIVSADVIFGPVTMADLREYLAHVLPEGFRIDHDDATDEIVIRTGLVQQLGGELFPLESDDDEPVAGPIVQPLGDPPAGVSWESWLAANNRD
jgi:hypothetical protein